MYVPLEAAKVRAIVALLKRRGAWVVKTTGVSLAGCPDLLCCYRGRFIALEVKREHDGKYGVSTKQKLELQRINHAGGEAQVVVDVIEVEAILNQIDLDEEFNRQAQLGMQC